MSRNNERTSKEIYEKRNTMPPFPLRQELVGKRFVVITDEGIRRGSKHHSFENYNWKQGYIRACSVKDVHDKELQVLVEYDGLSWEYRQWITIHEQTNAFLVEKTIVWAARTSQTDHAHHTTTSWPALIFAPLVDKLGFDKDEKRPIEYFGDKQLAFVEANKVELFKDGDENLPQVLSLAPLIQEDLMRWQRLQKIQDCLMNGSKTLTGARVTVYRLELRQWYTGCITAHNLMTRELDVMDDNVLQTHPVHPALVQIYLMANDEELHRISHGGEQLKVPPTRRQRSVVYFQSNCQVAKSQLAPNLHIVPRPPQNRVSVVCAVASGKPIFKSTRQNLKVNQSTPPHQSLPSNQCATPSDNKKNNVPSQTTKASVNPSATNNVRVHKPIAVVLKPMDSLQHYNTVSQPSSSPSFSSLSSIPSPLQTQFTPSPLSGQHPLSPQTSITRSTLDHPLPCDIGAKDLRQVKNPEKPMRNSQKLPTSRKSTVSEAPETVRLVSNPVVSHPPPRSLPKQSSSELTPHSTDMQNKLPSPRNVSALLSAGHPTNLLPGMVNTRVKTCVAGSSAKLSPARTETHPAIVIRDDSPSPSVGFRSTTQNCPTSREIPVTHASGVPNGCTQTEDTTPASMQTDNMQNSRTHRDNNCFHLRAIANIQLEYLIFLQALLKMQHAMITEAIDTLNGTATEDQFYFVADFFCKLVEGNRHTENIFRAASFARQEKQRDEHHCHVPQRDVQSPSRVVALLPEQVKTKMRSAQEAVSRQREYVLSVVLPFEDLLKKGQNKEWESLKRQTQKRQKEQEHQQKQRQTLHSLQVGAQKQTNLQKNNENLPSSSNKQKSKETSRDVQKTLQQGKQTEQKRTRQSLEKERVQQSVEQESIRLGVDQERARQGGKEEKLRQMMEHERTKRGVQVESQRVSAIQSVREGILQHRQIETSSTSNQVEQLESTLEQKQQRDLTVEQSTQKLFEINNIEEKTALLEHIVRTLQSQRGQEASTKSVMNSASSSNITNRTVADQRARLQNKQSPIEAKQAQGEQYAPKTTVASHLLTEQLLSSLPTPPALHSSLLKATENVRQISEQLLTPVPSDSECQRSDSDLNVQEGTSAMTSPLTTLEDSSFENVPGGSRPSMESKGSEKQLTNKKHKRKTVLPAGDSETAPEPKRPRKSVKKKNAIISSSNTGPANHPSNYKRGDRSAVKSVPPGEALDLFMTKSIDERAVTPVKVSEDLKSNERYQARSITKGIGFILPNTRTGPELSCVASTHRRTSATNRSLDVLTSLMTSFRTSDSDQTKQAAIRGVNQSVTSGDSRHIPATPVDAVARPGYNDVQIFDAQKEVAANYRTMADATNCNRSTTEDSSKGAQGIESRGQFHSISSIMGVFGQDEVDHETVDRGRNLKVIKSKAADSTIVSNVALKSKLLIPEEVDTSLMSSSLPMNSSEIKMMATPHATDSMPVSIHSAAERLDSNPVVSRSADDSPIQKSKDTCGSKQTVAKKETKRKPSKREVKKASESKIKTSKNKKLETKASGKSSKATVSASLVAIEDTDSTQFDMEFVNETNDSQKSNMGSISTDLKGSKDTKSKQLIKTNVDRTSTKGRPCPGEGEIADSVSGQLDLDARKSASETKAARQSKIAKHCTARVASQVIDVKQVNTIKAAKTSCEAKLSDAEELTKKHYDEELRYINSHPAASVEANEFLSKLVGISCSREIVKGSFAKPENDDPKSRVELIDVEGNSFKPTNRAGRMLSDGKIVNNESLQEEENTMESGTIQRPVPHSVKKPTTSEPVTDKDGSINSENADIDVLEASIRRKSQSDKKQPKKLADDKGKKKSAKNENAKNDRKPSKPSAKKNAKLNEMSLNGSCEVMKEYENTASVNPAMVCEEFGIAVGDRSKLKTLAQEQLEEKVQKDVNTNVSKSPTTNVVLKEPGLVTRRESIEDIVFVNDKSVGNFVQVSVLKSEEDMSSGKRKRCMSLSVASSTTEAKREIATSETSKENANKKSSANVEKKDQNSRKRTNTGSDICFKDESSVSIETDTSALHDSAKQDEQKNSTQEAKKKVRKPKEKKVKDPKENWVYFLQQGGCKSMPSMPQCRECQNYDTEEEAVLNKSCCRFDMFRRFRSRYNKVEMAGFSSSENTEREDLLPWLAGDEISRLLSLEVSKYILLNVGDEFCSLVKQEKEAFSLETKKNAIAWKRAVRGIREMCDACETTIFNVHWVCPKCGFGVCLDCYKAKINMSVASEDAGRAKRFLWFKCSSNASHRPQRLVLAHIIPKETLHEIGEQLHEAREFWGIGENCPCKKQQRQTTENLDTNIGVDDVGGVPRDVGGAKFLDLELPMDIECLTDNAKTWEDFERVSRKAIEGTLIKNGIQNSSESAKRFNVLPKCKAGESPEIQADSTPECKAGSVSHQDSSSVCIARNSFGALSLLADYESPVSSPVSEIDIMDCEESAETTPARMSRPCATVGESSSMIVASSLSNLSLEMSGGFPASLESKDVSARVATNITSELPAPHSWICSRPMLRLHCAHHVGNLKAFQSRWEQGEPVLVSDVHKHMTWQLWTPEGFENEFGSEKADVVNCKTGGILARMDIGTFWRGFESVKDRPVDNKGEPTLLKLKDWPPEADFVEKMPTRFNDLMNALPLPEYTSRDGSRNLVARLPDFFVKPDLGPKMYNAYGNAAFPSAGTTNLHIDMSDAVNVMVYVGVPFDEEYGEQERKDSLACIDAQCDEVQRQRARERSEKLGALWHIFAAEDANKIRALFRKVASENSMKYPASHDPIHDQCFYLDEPLLKRLKDEYGVVGWPIAQFLGDAIFIPAGAPHQVRNLHSCVKAAEDFVSPEHVGHCFKLTQEFRHLSERHTNHEDKLQVKNIIYHAVKDAVSVLRHRGRDLTPETEENDNKNV